ncbi:MAG TPA: DUF2007 domain-containing protein [Myxococcota bacterium]|nr:DUF2007 domain-containing protein [Myxococcota bacterium]
MERPPIPRTALPGNPDRLVEVASFPRPLEAHLAAARLRSEGLLVSLSGEHAAGLLSGVDCVRLWVREIDRARALESLAPVGKTTWAPRRRSSYFVTADLDAPRCPRCGSLALEAERTRGTFFAFLWALLLGAQQAPCLHCRLCKLSWRYPLGD